MQKRQRLLLLLQQVVVHDLLRSRRILLEGTQDAVVPEAKTKRIIEMSPRNRCRELLLLLLLRKGRTGSI